VRNIVKINVPRIVSPILIKDLGASPRGMNWRILFKNCEASLGELNPLEGLTLKTTSYEKNYF